MHFKEAKSYPHNFRPTVVFPKSQTAFPLTYDHILPKELLFQLTKAKALVKALSNLASHKKTAKGITKRSTFYKLLAYCVTFKEASEVKNPLLATIPTK